MPCPHCFGLYILGNLLRHVKSAHPLASLVSQASQVILFYFLQMFSIPVIFHSSIPLIT
jgi:hypothetical protein